MVKILAIDPDLRNAAACLFDTEALDGENITFLERADLLKPREFRSELRLDQHRIPQMVNLWMRRHGEVLNTVDFCVIKRQQVSPPLHLFSQRPHKPFSLPPQDWRHHSQGQPGLRCINALLRPDHADRPFRGQEALRAVRPNSRGEQDVGRTVVQEQPQSLQLASHLGRGRFQGGRFCGGRPDVFVRWYQPQKTTPGVSESRGGKCTRASSEDHSKDEAHSVGIAPRGFRAHDQGQGQG